jgi:competence ComEA-like helix-hairpin-helix protein
MRTTITAIAALLAAVAFSPRGVPRRPAGVPRPDRARPAPGQPLAAGLLFAGRVDLNRARLDDLVALPGIGEVRARRILTVRGELGGRFHDIGELTRVPGVGEKTIEGLRDLVSIDGT